MAVVLYNKCDQCHGTGICPPGSLEPDNECNNCAGTGYRRWGHFGTHAETLFQTYIISDNTVVSEYNALSAAQKATYKTILSMGIVDLAVGTTTRAALWSMFDADSATRANLLTLIGE